MGSAEENCDSISEVDSVMLVQVALETVGGFLVLLVDDRQSPPDCKVDLLAHSKNLVLGTKINVYGPDRQESQTEAPIGMIHIGLVTVGEKSSVPKSYTVYKELISKHVFMLQ